MPFKLQVGSTPLSSSFEVKTKSVGDPVAATQNDIQDIYRKVS